jgi:polyhydroxyalkanoate synthesis regulator protein
MWTQFMNMQAPLMQGMMGSSLEQSKNLLTQMQEAMQKQTEQVLGSFGSEALKPCATRPGSDPRQYAG